MYPQIIYIWYIFLYSGVRTVYGPPQLAHFHLLESYMFSTSTRIHHLYFKKWLLWGRLNWEMATDIYIYILLRLCISFPGGSVIKESACNAGDPPECGRSDFDLWFGKIPWRRKWQTTPVFLPGKCHGQRSLVGLQSMRSQESNKACL